MASIGSASGYDEHSRKFVSENSIDNSHPHNQIYAHYSQL